MTLDVEAFDSDRDAVWQRARNNGVSDLVIPAVTAAHWPALVALCDSDPHLHAALGLHPVYLEKHAPDDPGKLADALAASKPVAVGENGLDFALRVGGFVLTLVTSCALA